MWIDRSQFPLTDQTLSGIIGGRYGTLGKVISSRYLSKKKSNNAIMINLAKIVILLGVASLLFSCATGFFALGVFATVRVDTSNYSIEVIEASKKELVEFFQSLGLEEKFREIYKVTPKLDYQYFGMKKPDPEFSTSRIYHYNLYHYTKSFGIALRDDKRQYPNSAELVKEIDDLLALLRKYYKETEIEFKLNSTFTL